MKENKYARNWELTIAGFICILIALSHLTGVFEQEWLTDRISTITLLVLGLFIMLLIRVLERVDNRQNLVDLRSKIDGLGATSQTNQDHLSDLLDEVKTKLTNLLTRDSKAGVEIRQFENVGDVYDYVSSKLRAARNSVKDITWGSYTGYRNEHEQKCYDKYVRTIEDVCKKGEIVYEEISSLSDEQYFRRSTNLLKHYNYHLAYHDISCINVPLISYVIIDANEVVLGFCRVPGVTHPSDNIVYLDVTNPMLVRFFFDYFVSIWHQAVKLKESTQVNKSKIEEIRLKLGVN